jgi:hypothetical protein
MGTKTFQTTLDFSFEDQLDATSVKTKLSEAISSWCERVFSVQIPRPLEADGVFSYPSVSSASETLVVMVDTQYIKTSEIGEFRATYPFFGGVELTSLRWIQDGRTLQINVRTFISSSNESVSIHDIPRDSESLLALLNREFLGKLTVAGDLVKPIPWLVDRDNAADSILSNISGRSALPILVCDLSARQQSIVDALGLRFFGLAHVVSAVRAEPSDLPQGKIHVYWRDSGLQSESLELGFQVNLLGRRLVRHRLETDKFDSDFLEAYILSLQIKSSETGSDSIDDQTAEKLKFVELELQITRDESLLASRQRDEFIDEFSEELESVREMKRKLYKIVSIFQSNQKVKIEPSIELLSVDLGLSNIMESLELVSLITEGAILFTDNCASTWVQAKKAGYCANKNAKSVMEEEIRRLSVLAWDVARKDFQLGVSLPEYARLNHQIEVVMGDSVRFPSPNFVFDGAVFSQEPHIRADAGNTKNELGRIHFAIDSGNSRFIVNIIGNKQYDNGKS